MKNKLQTYYLDLILNNYKLCSNKGKICALRTMVSGIAAACTSCANATVKANCTIKRDICLTIE